MFGKKVKDTVLRTPKYIQVRSMYGTAYHFIPGDATLSTPTLCGYDSWVETNTVMEATSQDIIDGTPYQHVGWHWCPTCASILTGLPEDFFHITRIEVNR